MVPTSTPRETLNIETGLLGIETVTVRNRINMKARLNKNSSELIRNILSNPEGICDSNNRRIMKQYNIQDNDLTGSKYSTKRTINDKINEQFKLRMEEAAVKSKVKFLLEGIQNRWKPGKAAEYMKKLTRTQASTLFRARTRMLQMKNNFRNAHKELTCRACKDAPETQQHILEECTAIHRNEDSKVTNYEIFSNNINDNRQAATKIRNIINKLLNTP